MVNIHFLRTVALYPPPSNFRIFAATTPFTEDDFGLEAFIAAIGGPHPNNLYSEKAYTTHILGQVSLTPNTLHSYSTAVKQSEVQNKDVT